MKKREALIENIDRLLNHADNRTLACIYMTLLNTVSPDARFRHIRGAKLKKLLKK